MISFQESDSTGFGLEAQGPPVVRIEGLE